jgi:RimJ/RimL family protein N-acetyltransferase
LGYVLQTDRLRLREFNLHDHPFILELLNTPGWLKFIGDRNVRSADQAIKYLENGPLKSYREFGYGLSMVELQEDGTPVGMCGILNRDTLEFPDIGFAFLPTHHGKGFALEIVSALLGYADAKIGLPVIAAIVVPDNIKSINLLEKTGFTFEKMITLSGSTEALCLYKRKR